MIVEKLVLTNLDKLDLKAFLTPFAGTLCCFSTTSVHKQGEIREVGGNGNIVEKTYSAFVFKAVEVENFSVNVKIDVSGQVLRDKPILTVHASNKGRKVMLPSR